MCAGCPLQTCSALQTVLLFCFGWWKTFWIHSQAMRNAPRFDLCSAHTLKVHGAEVVHGDPHGRQRENKTTLPRKNCSCEATQQTTRPPCSLSVCLSFLHVNLCFIQASDCCLGPDCSDISSLSQKYSFQFKELKDFRKMWFFTLFTEFFLYNYNLNWFFICCVYVIFSRLSV